MCRFGLRPILLTAATILALIGCGDETTRPVVQQYYEPTSEMNVLHNLVLSWEEKDVAAYASLLADDFRFYFDEDTRIRKGLPEYWTRIEDSTGSGQMLAAPLTRNIQVALRQTQGPDTLTAPEQEGWTQVNVLNTYLEVEQDSSLQNPDGLTFIVESQIHHFYFRRGRTPDDTLATSPTSDRYYIVKWVDEGESWKPDTRAPRPTVAPEGATVVVKATWGLIKAFYHPSGKDDHAPLVR